MLNWEIVKEFCFKKLELPKEHRSHKINSRCPFCGDSKKSKTKKRFWIKFKDDENICIFHCFNCEVRGNFYKLYAFIEKIGEKDAREKFESTHIALQYVKNNLLNKTLITLENPDTEIKLFNWIKEYCFSKGENGYTATVALRRLEDFRKKRLIPDWVELFIAFKEPYTGRVIIPIYNENGDIIYFQARSLAKNPAIKYLNPEADKILKPDLSEHKEPLIVTEGLINSFMLPRHGTPCLGSSISDEFLKYLFSKFNDIIIASDNDKAGYKGLKKILNESIYASKLKYFLMPKEYKDINDLNELKMKKKNDINIIKFVIDNSFSETKVRICLKFDTWREAHEDYRN
jgi:hypothetical protein